MIIDPPADLPIRPTTQALAALQTTINAAGIGFFAGDLDRFGIYSLIVAHTHRDVPNARPIAVYSLAMSLARPFETVRRHVNALLAADLCSRREGGIVVSEAAERDAGIVALCTIAHDAFVHFVEAMTAADLLPPLPPATRAYTPMIGVAAAVETLLAAVASNRTLHDDWLSLAIFSTVLLGNTQRNRARAPIGTTPLEPRDAVRSGAVARVLNVPETTVRRRLSQLTAPGAPLLRVPTGLLASAGWLASARAAETSAHTYSVIRLILARIATQGFPFDDPASAYIVGAPSLPRFE